MCAFLWDKVCNVLGVIFYHMIICTYIHAYVYAHIYHMQASMKADYLHSVDARIQRFSLYLGDKPWFTGDEVTNYTLPYVFIMFCTFPTQFSFPILPSIWPTFPYPLLSIYLVFLPLPPPPPISNASSLLLSLLSLLALHPSDFYSSDYIS